MKKVPVREQEPKVRATNFEEVCYGYNEEEAVAEASRCLNCKNARCVQGCPVKIDIPAFVKEVKEGNYAEAAKVIGKSSALPAVCGRVARRRASVKASASAASKGEAVSIGKLEAFCCRLVQREQDRSGKAGEDKRHQGRCHRFRPVRTYLCRRSRETWL